MSEARGDATGYLGWFLLGTVVGAGVALLLAPQAGKETREALSEKGSELAKRAQDVTGDFQVRASELLEKGREAIKEQSQRLASAFEAGRQAMKEEIGQERHDG